MKHTLAILFSLVIGFAPLTSVSQTSTSTLSLAKQRELAVSLAPVKSAEDLKSYLRMTPKNSSPFRYLNAQSQRIFLNSLTFNETGLTGFDGDPLMKTLTDKQITSILSLFGSQHLASRINNLRRGVAISYGGCNELLAADGGCDSGDRYNHECEKHATCSWAAKKWCKSNC